MERVYITGRGLISPAGNSFKENCQALVEGKTNFKRIGEKSYGHLQSDVLEATGTLVRTNRHLRQMDITALLGILVCQEALRESRSYSAAKGVVFGSSRGPTENLENFVSMFTRGERLPAYASPTTTPNTIPSTIARHFGFNGMHAFVSGACSTGLHAVGLATTLLRANQFKSCLAGGVEWSNTPFVEEILNRTKVTSTDTNEQFPHRPFHPDRKGMVLSSGAAALTLDKSPHHALCEVVGYGAATDSGTMTGVSAQGEGLQLAIHRCLRDAGVSAGDIDLIVAHGAGTVKGDASERAALCQVFGKDRLPLITHHKWLTGHMLGASAASSIAFASEHLANQLSIRVPFESPAGINRTNDRSLARVMVLSLGFGGNAGALILRRLEP